MSPKSEASIVDPGSEQGRVALEGDWGTFGSSTWSQEAMPSAPVLCLSRCSTRSTVRMPVADAPRLGIAASSYPTFHPTSSLSSSSLALRPSPKIRYLARR